MKVSVALCVARVVLIAAFFLSYHFSSSNVNSRQEEFSDIISNWKTNLIGNIGESSSESVWNGTYYGTYHGCYCLTSDSESGVYYGLHRHECSFNETSHGCKDIPSLPQQQLTIWRHGEKTPYNRITESSFLSLYPRMDQLGNCREGSKRCGNVSSISRGICVPEEWRHCPVSRISKSSGDQSRGQSDKGVSSWNAGLEFTNAEDYNPVVELTVVENRKCLNPNYQAVSPDRKVYKLQAGKPMAKCITDTRYEEADAIGEIALFEQNRIRYQGLPTFKTSNDFKWKRMYRRIIEWKPSCLEEVPFVLSVYESLSKLSWRHNLFYWVSFVLMLAIVVLQIYGYNQITTNKPRDEIVLFSRIRLGIIGCMVLILLPSLLAGSPIAQHFKKLASMNCGDRLTQKVIENSHLTMQFDFHLFSIFSLCMWVFLGASDNIEAVWNKMRSQSKRRAEYLPANLPQIDDDVFSFVNFLAVVTSFS